MLALQPLKLLDSLKDGWKCSSEVRGDSSYESDIEIYSEKMGFDNVD
jgi:hypothetical protein